MSNDDDIALTQEQAERVKEIAREVGADVGEEVGSCRETRFQVRLPSDD